MLSRNRYALKEWEGVCGRLARGAEILLVRKGGILERRDGFQVEHREFFLFPTQFHEKGGAPPDRVAMDLYASVEADVLVADLERLRALQGCHGTPWEDVEHRFHYGKEKGVHVIALRAYRLARPEVVENARAYDGCRSWVELDRERAVDLRDAAVPDEEFRRKFDAAKAILHG